MQLVPEQYAADYIGRADEFSQQKFCFNVWPFIINNEKLKSRYKATQEMDKVD